MARRSLRDTSAFADEVGFQSPGRIDCHGSRGESCLFSMPLPSGYPASIQKPPWGRRLRRFYPFNFAGLKDRLDRGIIIREEEMMCLFGDEQIPVSVSAARIVNVDNEVVGRIIILRDLLEVYRLQAEIRASGKAGRPRRTGCRCGP